MRWLVAQETGHAPRELIEETLKTLPRAMSAREREALRNRLLAQAVRHFDGGPWQRSEQLAAVIRRWTGRDGGDPIRGALCRAADTGLKLPTSARQIYRIIADTDV